MSLRFMERPFDPPATTRDVVDPHPTVATVEIDDEVVLYLEDDRDQDAIDVRVMHQGADGELLGEISRANRPGARGDARLARGASLAFHERNVIRYAKAPR